MIFTTVRLERPEGSVQATGIAVLIEQAATDEGERLDLGGARPYDVFWISSVQGVPANPFQRRDVLVDEHNSDPETGQLAVYRIAGVVETFDNDHQEAYCERVVGA
ncbi:MAG TPA: hypothetical protein VF120_12960 [Ktedonobacterales bacterium]